MVLTRTYSYLDGESFTPISEDKLKVELYLGPSMVEFSPFGSSCTQYNFLLWLYGIRYPDKPLLIHSNCTVVFKSFMIV